MARQKKATSKPRARKVKTVEPVVPTVVVTDDEKALVAKYCGTHQIVPGSLRYAGGREGWGNKRTVEVRCASPECASVRIVASSDLQWDTTRYCAVCAADILRNRRRTRDAKKNLKRQRTVTDNTKGRGDPALLHQQEQAVKTVHEMILAAGGYQHLRTHPLAIENPPFMKLCIEWVGDWYEDSMLVSVAHYREFGDSGDYGCDPDIVFAVWGDGATWMAVAFEMSGAIYQEAAYLEDGKLMVRKKWQNDINEFAKQWSHNLKAQHFPEALAAQPKK